MKKALLLTLSAFLFFTACAKKEPSLQEQSGINLPDWILDPYVEGKIAAVGIAPKSKGGFQFQIPQAEADARANIAAQLNTEVSRLTKNALRAARIAEQEEVENVFSQVTKNLIKKVPLRGARRINIYVDPDKGDLYVHMALDNEMILTHFEKSQDVYAQALKNASLSRKSLDNAQDAVKELYDELDKELQ